MNYLRAILLREPPQRDLYLNDIPAVRQLLRGEPMEFSRPVTVFVGENGTGKSTILEAIAVAMGFNAEGGGREHRFATQDSHSELWRLLSTVKSAFPDDGFFLRAESFYNTSSYIDQSGSRLGRYGYRQLHTRSHGVAFLALVQSRFEGRGLYLLDEPEAALSPQRLLSLLVAIHDLVELDSQFIIATHSPLIMAFPGAEIKLFDETGVRTADYRDTEHYQITKQFINDPERMLNYLFETQGESGYE